MRTSLQKGEKILLVTHGSWTMLILPIFIALLGIVGSYFIGFIEHYGWIAAVLGLLYLLIRYATWKANIWVVTNFRVIDEVGLFNHYAKESSLDKINNVSYKHSLMGRIFSYGDVEIQTAAQVGATTYFNVNHPKLLQETIVAAQSELKQWEYGNQARQMAAAIGGGFGIGTGGSAGTDGGGGLGAGGRAGTDGGLSGGTGGSGATHQNAPQVAAELEKLFELKMKGAISEDEYVRAKNRLLNH